MISADEARDRGLGAARGCLIGLAFTGTLIGILAALAWLLWELGR